MKDRVSGDDSETATVMEEKGKQKSVTSINASLTMDFRQKRAIKRTEQEGMGMYLQRALL